VVVNAIESHHEDVPQETPYAAVVLAADAISAARPGARLESEERHGRRLRELEKIAAGFPGVESAFAVRAGRELRVVVDAARVPDERAHDLAREIAKAVEAGTAYPGEIRVSVFRETRATHYAR
jgi:ribonuclease Y